MATNFYGPVKIGTKVTVESGGTYIHNKVEAGGVNNEYAFERGDVEEVAKESEKMPPLDEEKLRIYIGALLPQIELQNHWFAIMKPLVWQGELVQGDYDGAVRYIRNLFPEGLPVNIKADDLRKIDCLCFTKPIDKWNENDAPIKGNRYQKMYTLASCFWNMISKHEKRQRG